MCLLFALVVTVVACTPAATPAPAQPVEAPAVTAILQYLQVRNTSDENALAALVCAAFESDARAEALALASRDPKLENAQCAVSNDDGDTTLVKCTGQVATVYNGESQRPIDLSRRIFRVVSENGQLKMCGYSTP